MQSLLKVCARGVQRQFIRDAYAPHIGHKIQRMATDAMRVAGGVPAKMRAQPALMKIDTPEFHSIFSDELRALIRLFDKYKYDIRIAGGAVRDIIMQIQPKDIDLATTATPAQMKEMFTRESIRMINAKGEKHGTITARIHDKENFEVTTLRIDVRTDGRHAEVQFTTDWQLDANRRDLTINSMFLGFDGTLYDYFYGYEDLQQRRVVFVGDADVRIKEDYLRILRYFRFYGRIARHSGQYDSATIEAIRANAEGLARISGERLWSELQKIVVGNFGCDLLLEMNNCRLLQYCGLPPEPNVAEFKRLYADLRQFSEPHLPILYLTALLNSPEDALRLHQRLKLSVFERDTAIFITQHRDKVDKEYISLHDYQKWCVLLRVKPEFVEQLLKYSNKLQLYTEFKSSKIPRFPITGDLLKERGYAEGMTLGGVLWRLKLVWADSEFTLTADELLDKHLPEILASSPSPSPTASPAPTKKFRKSE